jgi:uncharacterized DUF497 family protein
MHFEWDETKNEYNIKKHGITFQAAIQCWRDPRHFDFFDEDHSTVDEERWRKFGCLPDGRVICVIYTEVAANHFRLISSFSDKTIEEIYYAGNEDN